MARFGTDRAGSKRSSAKGNASLLYGRDAGRIRAAHGSSATETEERMGKSHQAGWVSLRGKYWYGYFRETVLDPETNEERVRKVPVRLGLRGALRAEITKRSGEIPKRTVLKDSSVTFAWVVRNR